MKILAWSLLIVASFVTACTSTKTVQHSQPSNGNIPKELIEDSVLKNAHVGIAVYDAAAGKYLYNYQGDKYFTPASNTKLVTCYAAMKYLSEYLTGLDYAENDTAIFLSPSADPTLLHPDFSNQPVISFLQKTSKPLYILNNFWKTNPWGYGWSWDDYTEDYMAERSALPVYGNVIKWEQQNSDTAASIIDLSKTVSIYSTPEVNWKVKFTDDTSGHFAVRRDLSENIFRITQGRERKASKSVPFVTNGVQSALELLADTIHKEITEIPNLPRRIRLAGGWNALGINRIYSQALDSVLKPMMYRSDNFFAEQLLQMVSFQVLQQFNDDKIIDTLLKTDLKDLPQTPTWADGSGLSRFNLFTPEDFVMLLKKMEQEFGMQRIRGILPTGGTGTLKNYYKADSNFIYAKTGTLTGVLALSGYIFTKQNKMMIFSVLVNNHTGEAWRIRRKVEAFLQDIREKN
ncbi:hypothetical protein HHL16_02140 [Pseudoflavitalea sp. G-6-1-2]|uniref:D-alanyl-D-alanine carboxypeptidase/D-alanyl-D-alanine-endopeptidase n=1 Tax=Pseudoflavitalea sp. G-6-1-2 TaxID=2728841 RepID=UPI00146A4A7B|nr:D-alanyl-D-alanine carboxypeptidase [Pseudoflavitalea sp. G-6-1-2]NML19650.1 hypothetical protein [Pseudoflavitalea sp. G-6-1-2]